MSGDEDVDAYLEMQKRRRSTASQGVYVDLQPGETTIANMASRIYAARLSSGAVVPGEEDEAVRKSVMEALRMAHYVERWVKDAAEGQP